MVGWGGVVINPCCALISDQARLSCYPPDYSRFPARLLAMFLRGICQPQLAFSLFPSWPVGAVGWRGGLMTEKAPPLGSYGLRLTQDSLSRRTSASGGRPTAVFGKRTQPVYQNHSLQHVSLSHLLSEFKALFDDNAIHGEAPEFVLVGETEEPRLLIGGETGYFVFREKAVDAGLVVVTSSDERLIDHVVCHLAAEAGAAGSETCNVAARMLVGEHEYNVVH